VRAEVFESKIKKLMGTDVRVVKLANGKYGWAVDQRASTDLQQVSGIPNLVQGLLTRMETEQGTNLNFTRLGLPRVIGQKSLEQRWYETRFAIDQQVIADPRIERLVAVRFTVENQTITMDVDAQPVGFDSRRPIPVMLT
jgi:hypothetical protein